MTKELKGNSLVSARLKKHIQHFSFIVDGPPELHLLAPDLQENFVYVPSRTRPGPLRPKSFRVFVSEFLDPTANCFIRNVDASLREKIFDIPITQRKSKIEPNGVLDDGCKK